MEDADSPDITALAKRFYDLGIRLYATAGTAEAIAQMGIPVETGRFRTEMQVSLINDGPVTILLDSEKAF